MSTIARPAAAQNFPAASAYQPLPCGAGPMVDAAGDTPGATGALDLVGTVAQPAGFHAADAQFLYLRMRVAASPIAGARLMTDAWGYEFDLDGDAATYEVLISVSGTSATDEVDIFRHPTTTSRDNPADPALTPPVFTYPFASHAQAVAAASTLGGGSDNFIDIALPWTDLDAVGIQPNTPVRIWAGSSTVANALNLDLACFSGAGGRLTTSDVGLTAPDPAFASGVTDGGATGPRTLEGGPGCAIGGRTAMGFCGLVLLVVISFTSRRRRGT